MSVALVDAGGCTGACSLGNHLGPCWCLRDMLPGEPCCPAIWNHGDIQVWVAAEEHVWSQCSTTASVCIEAHGPCFYQRPHRWTWWTITCGHGATRGPCCHQRHPNLSDLHCHLGQWGHLGQGCCWGPCLGPWWCCRWGLWLCQWPVLAEQSLEPSSAETVSPFWSWDGWPCASLNTETSELALTLRAQLAPALEKDGPTADYRNALLLGSTLEVIL